MFSQEKEDNVEVQPNGNFLMIKNSIRPPTKIEGILFKEGHIVKNWKKRLIVVERGVLSYYSLKESSIFQTTDRVLKGSFNLKGYSIQKTNHEMYLWPSKIGAEGKDLKLHTSVDNRENPYPMKVWVAAVRCHIRYAHQTFSSKFDWYPFYQAVLIEPSRSIFDGRTTYPNTPFYQKKLFQVVRRDGAMVEKELETRSDFVSFKRYHEFVEVREILFNLQNDCRGKLTSGEGWVTISTSEGSVVLTELLPLPEGKSGEERKVDGGGTSFGPQNISESDIGGVSSSSLQSFR